MISQESSRAPEVHGKAKSNFRWLCATFVLCVSLLSACTQEPPPVPPSALQAVSGDIQLLRIWSSKTGEAGRGLFEPLVIEDQIFVASRGGRISAFNRDTGMRQWRTDLDVTLISGVGGSGQRLFVSDDNARVHAINAATGEQEWQSSASSEVLMPVVAGFGVAVLRSADGRVVALEPEDGSERWTFFDSPPALTLNGYSRPLLVDGGVLLGLDDGRLVALNMASGDTIWEAVLSVPAGRTEVERLVDVDADMVVDNEGIYVANYQGKAARLEPSRGQLVWSVPLSAGSGVALDGEALIVVDEDDRILKLDKVTGEQLWMNDSMTSRRFSPPAYTPAGDILLGDVEGYVHVLSRDDGKVLGRIRTSDEAIKARPLVVEDTVYIQTTDGVLAAYRVSS